MSDKKAFWGFALLETLFWFASASGDYLTVYLQKQGFTTIQIGFVNAVNAAVSIAANPFWGVIADRWRSIRKTFVISMGAGIVLMALVPGSVAWRPAIVPLLPMYVVLAIGTFFRAPAGTLVDAFMVQKCVIEKVNYGPIRSCGSLSYAVMAISLSFIMPKAGVGFSFYLYGILFIPVFIVMMKNTDAPVDDDRKRVVPLREMQFGKLFTEYYFLTYIIFVVLLNMAINMTYTFMPFLISEVGEDSARNGLLGGYRAIIEVPMLLLLVPIRRFFPLPLTLILACVLYIFQYFLYADAQSLTGIMFLGTLAGMGQGLVIGAATNYVFALSPKGLNSTATTVYAASTALASIIGNILGGVLIDTTGVRNFFRICGIIVFFAMVFFAASLLFGMKALRKPLPVLALSARGIAHAQKKIRGTRNKRRR